METAAGADRWVPATSSISELREAAKECRGCDLYKKATQTVFGSGDPDASVVVVGEMPGDREDREGLPFVGPAGALLSRALSDAGIDRTHTYLTNVVKHFRFRQTRERGKRRIHESPNRSEVVACRPWLVAELRALSPTVVVVLGTTAGRAIFGSSFRVSADRGHLVPMPELDGHQGFGDIQSLATIHPSAVLRSDDRATMYKGLVEDLCMAARVLD